MGRFIAAALVLGIASPAFADIRGSVGREGALASQRAARASALQARPNAAGNDDNPYFLPSMIIMGGGALVALYGMTHDTGAECSGIGASSFSCGTTKSKTTIFTGVGMIGAGAYLYYKGKQRQNRSPQVVFGPGAIGVRQQLTW